MRSSYLRFCQFHMRIVSKLRQQTYQDALYDPLTVIGATQYPRQLMMEEDGTDIVQMTIQCKETPASLI